MPLLAWPRVLACQSLASVICYVVQHYEILKYVSTCFASTLVVLPNLTVYSSRQGLVTTSDVTRSSMKQTSGKSHFHKYQKALSGLNRSSTAAVD